MPRTPTRHTYSTIAALEDSIAIGLNAQMEVEIALQRLIQRRDEFAIEQMEQALVEINKDIDRLLKILRTARKSTDAYSRNTPIVKLGPE